MKISALQVGGLLLLGPNLVSGIVLGVSCDKKEYNIDKIDPLTGKKGNVWKSLLENIMDKGTVSFKTWKSALERNFDGAPEAKKEFEFHFPTKTDEIRKTLIARITNLLADKRNEVRMQKTADEKVDPKDEILVECDLDMFKKEDPTDPTNDWYERTMNTGQKELSYLRASTYDSCKLDTKAVSNGVPDVNTQGFTQPHKLAYLPDQLYLCPQWLAWLQAVGGYRQESWIFTSMHRQQLEHIPSYTWPQSKLDKQTQNEMVSEQTGGTWITEDKSERAIWTIVHELTHTEKFKEVGKYGDTGTEDTPQGEAYDRIDIMKHHEPNNADTVASAFMSYYRLLTPGIKIKADVPGEWDPKWTASNSKTLAVGKPKPASGGSSSGKKPVSNNP
ncbi:hypothetical protein GLAREA_01189 [Glarea lozoyensis ATCC 20868]|uniref:Lysine-specific metallo-endopeptidase domain-containing protein n=1 Tax=Glarea lozoyensis (strain ATCC 20868 / MF5171) TaxID=1116229 RepID=S3CFN2_GLAL2|nr:uncharacterized protein GLAREA_01189 [Glarea lozoyensis ATCC 20868]EPE25277.1 hypothetical protein GLAREA_01189 [Glarea lozoyensis ATCC 20868]